MDAKVIAFLLKHIVEITIEYRGRENIPDDGKFIVACKHQSAWETVSLHEFVNHPTVIMKKELLYIPIFGQVIYFSGAICIDRKKGKKVIPQMIEGAKKSFANNRPVFMFPEGTRGTPGVPGRYRHGIASLYGALDVPVLPIALNSGLFWPRREFLKKPGHLIVEFLPPIQPGLGERKFLKELANSIETAVEKITPKDFVPEKDDN